LLTDIATTESVSLRTPNESGQPLSAFAETFDLPAADLLPAAA